MGEVWVALDRELQREVALKRLQAPYHQDAEGRRRFLLEAEITGRLEHPGIVPVYGLGQDREGRPCYAMHFIRGESLQAAIQRFHAEDRPGRDPGERGLALRQLLGRFLAVCNTIAYAHSRGIMHRDLKPGNVMLGRYGETLVVDWGLAKAFERTEVELASGEDTLTPLSADDPSGTRMGKAMGTPAYMSPEQAAGRWDRVGPATDVFSLGAVLYALLTGQAPYQGRNIAEILLQVRQGAFPPPRQVKPAVSAALEAVCQKAMAPEPGGRYATALDLAAEVERWLADEPVRAYREPGSARRARWRRRHRTLLTAAAMLLVTAVVALGVGTLLIYAARRDETEQKGRAEEAHRLADANARAAAEARRGEEVARQDALRTALAGYHSSAESLLAEARVLRQAPSRDRRREEALDRIAQAVALERKARAVLRELGEAAGDLARTEPRDWEKRRRQLRDEAAHWLTDIGLEPTRTVTLPPPPPPLKPLPQDQVQDSQWLAEHGDRVLFVRWLVELAFSPDGSHLAVAYAGARELWLIPSDGGTARRLPLPEELPSLQLGFKLDALRFLGKDRIELSTTAEVVTWTLPEGGVQYRRRSPQEAEEIKQRIEARLEEKAQARRRLHSGREAVLARSPTHAASASFGTSSGAVNKMLVSVRPADGTAEPRVVWQAEAEHLEPGDILFGGDPRFLFILTERGKRLAVVDLLTGLSGSELLSDPAARGTSARGVLLPCPGGVASLETTDPDREAEGTRRVRFWQPVFPRSWKHAWPQSLALTCLDLAGDGLLAAGGEDHVVSLWKDQERAWSAGIPREDEQDLDTHYPWWDFGATGKQSLVVERRDPRGRDPGLVWTEVYHPEDGRLLHAFPSRGPGRILRVSPDHRFAVVAADEQAAEKTLDLWSLDEVRPLVRLGTYAHPEGPALPEAVRGWLEGRESFVNRVRAIQDTTHGQLHTANRLRSWRSYLLVRSEDLPEKGQDVEVGVSTFFSPSGRWLAVVDRPAGRVEIWQLPEGKCLGKVSLPGTQVRPVFDPQERRLLLVGPSYGGFGPPLGRATHPPFGRLIDLASATPICDLLDLENAWDVDGSGFRFSPNSVIAVQQRDPNGLPYRVTTWDARTGRRTGLPLPTPETTTSRAWDPRGVRIRLSPDGTKLLLEAYARTGNDYLARVQLLDLVGQRLLREAVFPGVTYLTPGTVNLTLAGDHEHVYLSLGNAREGEAALVGVRPPTALVVQTVGGKPVGRSSATLTTPYAEEQVYWVGEHRVGKRGKLTCWRWSDGGEVPAPPETLLAADEDFRWALWRGPAGVRAYDGVRDRSVGLENTAGGWEHRTSDGDGRLVVLEDSSGPRFRSGVWDAHTGRRLLSFPASHRFRALDSTGRWAGTFDQRRGEMRVWDTRSGEPGNGLRLPSLAWDPGGFTSRWSLTYADLRMRPREMYRADLRIHPGGDWVAVLSQAAIRLRDLAAVRPLRTVPKPGHFTPLQCVAQHAGAGLVASAAQEAAVLLWDRRDGRLLHTLLGHAGTVTALAFDTEGTRLASASRDGSIIVWQADGRRVWTYRERRGGTRFLSLAFQPQTGVLAAATEDGRVLLLEVRWGELLDELTADGSAVQALAFSLAGDRLAAGTVLGQVPVWDTESRNLLRTFATGSPVRAVALPPGGHLLLTGGETLQLRDLSGDGVLTVTVPGGPVQSLALGRAGNELVVAGRQGFAGVLDLDGLHRELRDLGLELPGYPFEKP
jgi:WD40 repeat protein/tRNA A-37 threonylcarbamoyl transferase component Bud32